MANRKSFSTSEVRAMTGAGPGQLQRWIRDGLIPGMEQRPRGAPQPRREFTAGQVEVVRKLVKEREKVHERAAERRMKRGSRRSARVTPTPDSKSSIREVRVASSDSEANDLLRQGWELHTVATTGLAVQFVLVKRIRARARSES